MEHKVHVLARFKHRVYVHFLDQIELVVHEELATRRLKNELQFLDVHVIDVYTSSESISLLSWDCLKKM